MKQIIIKSFNFIPAGSMAVYYTEELLNDWNREIYPSEEEYLNNNTLVGRNIDSTFKSGRFKLLDIQNDINFRENIIINQNIEFNEESPSCSIFDSKGNVRKGYIVIFCPDVETLGPEKINDIRQKYEEEGLVFPEHLYTRGDKPIEDTYTNLWPLYVVEININKLKNYDTAKGFIPFSYSETINEITKEDISPEYIIACYLSKIPMKLICFNRIREHDYSLSINYIYTIIKVDKNTIFLGSPYESGYSIINIQSAKTNRTGTIEPSDTFKFEGDLFK
jgi:hypothetical protein